ncbi:hypothetical protein S7711_06594 [Stachybotrys chartarum IBT 7711]|uniref:Myb-like domain-containing protein n=1 Tax=Stachybotrys chartarum (strain CBS 109288 / IBT 7711) TaxID=1280523 RepID=A0A084AYP8_STACB|nr:hypothetical protein S7711_06594 [Stachybotrys chartarum IBT 7711]KFA50232.1 hypothetical protein S40293_03377 [Stachybotrys chartarum IBT 40293]
MPPKKAATGEGESPLGLTENELRFIKAVFDNMTQKPDANWVQVAGDLGLKDAKCAKERFRQMSVRHGWRDSAPAAATASPRKPKAAAAAGVGDDAKVTKKRSPAKKRAAPAKREERDDDEASVKVDEEGEDVQGVKMEAVHHDDQV